VIYEDFLNAPFSIEAFIPKDARRRVLNRACSRRRRASHGGGDK